MDAHGDAGFPAASQARNAGDHPTQQQICFGTDQAHPVPHPKPVDGSTQVTTNMNLNDPAGVAPAILRLHPGLDHGQLELISHLEGPTLGIAGPGTGKTLAVALRGTNILLRGLAQPEDLVLCTYSRPAAQELRQRFIALATAAGCPGDLSRVRIGTIHSLCRHMLRSHGRRRGPRTDFEVLNEDEQWRLLSRHFNGVFGPDLNVLEREGWRWREPDLVIRHGRKFFERLCDELIDPEVLIDSGDPFHAALGRCYQRYRDLLLDEGSADFDHLQRWAAELLEDGRTAGLISAGIRYLICDEYQDTSYIQERILLRLCRDHGNICVVGDDDQSIYWFRGASVRNLLQFPGHFSSCHTVELNVNHRSHPAIVAFYDRWMATAADWSNPDPQGRTFRHPKSITSHAADLYQDYPAVIRVAGCNAREEGAQLADLLRFLKRQRVIAEYGQVALLLHSVRGTAATGYLDALERAGIPVDRRPSGSGGRRAADRPRALTVTTVHQAKGREWDVVIVGSLDYCNPDVDPVGRELQHYCLRPAFEPPDRTSDFDHARQHYVAFSRPRGLLVLTSGDMVHPRLEDAWGRLPRWDRMNRGALTRQRFQPPEQTGNTERSPCPVPVAPSLRRLDVWVGRAASLANGPRLKMPEERRSHPYRPISIRAASPCRRNHTTGR